jgi:hypothetical protein
MTQTPNKASYSDQKLCVKEPATFVNRALITTMEGVAKITFVEESDILEVSPHVVANIAISYVALYNLRELITHALTMVKLEKAAQDGPASEYVQSGETKQG